MGWIILIVIIILIAQIGFWDTLEAVLGGLLLIALLVVLLVVLAVAAGMWLMRRLTR